MAEFWHNDQTKKSFDILTGLRQEFDFILIGGWAVYLYTRALKSKDIDLIVNFDDLEKFKAKFNIAKNERLKKYEAKTDGIDIDIYLPYYSDLGVPVEEIKGESHAGFKLPPLELLLILKQNAYHDRVGSIKGEKDRLDIINILKTGIDFNKYFKLLKRHNHERLKTDLVKVLKQTKEAKELGLNQNSFARLKRKLLTALK